MFWNLDLVDNNNGTPFVLECKKRFTFVASIITNHYLNETVVFIKQENYLFPEQSIDGNISYDTVLFYKNTDHSLQFIAQSSENWCACNGEPLLHS